MADTLINIAEGFAISEGNNNVAIEYNAVTIGEYIEDYGINPSIKINIKTYKFRGITLNYENIGLYRMNEHIKHQYVNVIFPAILSVYNGSVYNGERMELTIIKDTGIKHHFTYASFEEFTLFWNILDRRILIEKTGFCL